MNPGSDEAFPWLSKIATGYETYQVHSFKAIFSSSLPTTTSGAVYLVPDYDAGDDDSSLTKASLLAHQDAVRGPIWAPLTLSCGKANLGNQKRFNRSDVLLPNLDVKTYDFMQLIVIIEHASDLGSTLIGELWFEYDITFHTPCLDDGPSNTLILDATASEHHPIQEYAKPFESLISVKSTDPTVVVPKTQNLPAAIGATGSLMIAEAGEYLITLVTTWTHSVVSSAITSLTTAISSVTGTTTSMDPVTGAAITTGLLTVTDEASSASPAQFEATQHTNSSPSTLTYVAMYLVPAVASLAGNVFGSSYFDFGGQGYPIGIRKVTRRNRSSNAVNTISKRSSLTNPEAEGCVPQVIQSGDGGDIEAAKAAFRAWFYTPVSSVFPDEEAWEQYANDPVRAAEMRAALVSELSVSRKLIREYL